MQEPVHVGLTWTKKKNPSADGFFKCYSQGRFEALILESAEPFTHCMP